MASPTKKVRMIRKRKKSKMGKVRKAKNKNKGTTLSYEGLFGSELNS